MPKPQYRWPAGLRDSIFQRDHYTCQIRLPKCTHKATAIHHIKDTADGGNWFDPANLQAACTYCNSALGHPNSRYREKDPPPSRQW